MAAKKPRGEATSGPVAERDGSPPDVAAPPPSRWQLVTSSILVGLWIIFLAWMAFTG